MAGEVTSIDGDLPLFCIPAQLTIPLLVRWMLVFESSDDDVLYLGRALPRAWLASGETIEVHDAPTSWGRVGFELRVDRDTRAATATVELTGARRPREIHLRLRLPKGERLASASVNGRAVKPRGDTLVLAGRDATHFEIRARIT